MELIFFRNSWIIPNYSRSQNKRTLTEVIQRWFPILMIKFIPVLVKRCYLHALKMIVYNSMYINHSIIRYKTPLFLKDVKLIPIFRVLFQSLSFSFWVGVISVGGAWPVYCIFSAANLCLLATYVAFCCAERYLWLSGSHFFLSSSVIFRLGRRLTGLIRLRKAKFDRYILICWFDLPLWSRSSYSPGI